MSFILTLVASSTTAPLTEKHFKTLAPVLDAYNIEITSKPQWLSKNIAAQVSISQNSQSALVQHLREELKQERIDFFITPEQHRRKKLLLADMDSTIAATETLDELAAYAGIKEQIAAITAKAMEGKLDFHAALKERVGLLKDLPSSALEETLEQTALNPGAEIFAQTMRDQGTTCVLVSGGFTFFTSEIAKRAGFEFHHGNILDIENGKLTGKVKEPILDKYAKVDFLKSYIQDLGITPEETMTIGDGANDIPMLKMAGLGIGYRPKQTVADEIHNTILYGDLTAALYAQGYASKEFSGRC